MPRISAQTARLSFWLAMAAAAGGAEGDKTLNDMTVVITQPARQVPTHKMVDGPLLGNGDVGVVMAGTPDLLRFHIGKNDFWGIGTQAPMTVGQIQLGIKALAGATFRAEQDMELAEVRGAFSKEGAAAATRAWVDANANLIAIEVSNAGTHPLAVEVQLVQGASSAPIRVSASEAAFCYDPDRKPEGRRVAVCARLLGGTLAAEAVVLQPGERVFVAAAVLSDLDARDPAAAAREQAGALGAEALAKRQADHRAWWREFWSRSFIDIPDKVLQQHWYAAQYIMGCCSRPGKVAPGLWGNWITMDKPAWHGDFHLNYNFQAPFYGVYASNHPELSLPFYQAILDFVPRGRRIAAKRGWKGVHFPVSIGPWGMCPEGDDSDWGQRSNAAYAALNFIWYYQHTQDLEWLKTAGYPFLREVADFWEHYLEFEPNPAGGRYVIRNDSIHEGSGADMNAILTLGLVKTLFRNLPGMSRDLGVDADRVARWQDIHDKISEFPTQERNGKLVFRYSEQGTAWWNDNTLGVQHIFPAGAIGLDSPPRLLEISHNMIEAMARWEDFNGSSSWYTSCARVGYDPAMILAQLRAMADRQSMPNRLISFGGGGIENVAGFHAITEMMLQSHEGVLRLFPCWPKDQAARFGTLRAAGAFLVSAEIKGGAVGGVALLSEKGKPCTLENPWPGKKVQLTRDGRAAEAIEGKRLVFPTRPGERITCSVDPGTI